MNTGLDTRPSAATYEMEKLVGMAWRGQIRVPHFQRDFRWNREDVVRLFDSIVKGFPVGSLLLWVRPAPAKRISLGALQIDARFFANTLCPPIRSSRRTPKSSGTFSTA